MNIITITISVVLIIVSVMLISLSIWALNQIKLLKKHDKQLTKQNRFYKSIAHNAQQISINRVAQCIKITGEMSKIIALSDSLVKQIEDEVDMKINIDFEPLIIQTRRNHEISKMQYFATFGYHFDQVTHNKIVEKQLRDRDYSNIDMWFSRN